MPSIFFLCFLSNVHPNPAIHRLATTVKRLSLLPGVTTLFRDFTGGLSLVPLITFYSVESFIAGVRETSGKHFKGFYLSKIDAVNISDNAIEHVI